MIQIPGSGRYTIAQVMIGIAVLASLLAVPRLVRSPELVVMICLVGLLTVLVAIHVIVENVVGRPCPACGQWALRRLVRHRCYYRCAACRQRFKRFGFGPWLDASGPEDAARFRKRSEAGTWKSFTAPKDLSGTTSGALLRNKRSRDLREVVKRMDHHPSPGPGLENAARRVSKALARLRALRK
ncbi:MAG: hypothetical protein ACP5XB_04730 [Isosphaeraceae bacterium]